MQAPGSAIDSTYPLSIGGHVNSSYVFNGRVDEVSLYKRLLTADERTWMHNSGNGRAYSEVAGGFTYGDASHKHAVTALAGNTYTYDANGNQITRVIGTDTFNLAYDAENRLVQVQKNGATIATFTFDADGKRVKSIMGAETILFVGAHYEIKNGSEITKYYFAGTTRVAMRTYTVPQNSTLTYLMSDHLGSASLAVNATTGAVVETRYKAWGEVRYTTPNVTLPTRNTFTGQYSYISDEATDLGSSGFGLMFYNARWYDPYINHFTQADTIIPQTQGTQAWDRYAGMNNNPVRYNDPSGHVIVGDGETHYGFGCSDSVYCKNGRPRSPEESRLLHSIVRIGIGYFDHETRTWYGGSGLGTVTGDRSTIVTANHIREYAGGAAARTVFINGKPYFNNQFSSSGDVLTVTLPNELPTRYIPAATGGSSYQPSYGDKLQTVYQDSNGVLDVAPTTISRPFSNPSPSGWVRQATNPGNILDGGDSGGGVFSNGLLIGVNSSVTPDWGALWIAFLGW